MPKTKGFILDIAKTKGFSEKRKLLKQESKNKNKTKTKGLSATLEKFQKYIVDTAQILWNLQ